MNLVALALNLATFILLPRFLGPADWGVYVVWFSLWGLSSQILESGGAVVMNRFLPILRCDRPQRILPFLRGLLALKIALLPVVWIFSWLVLTGPESSGVFRNFSAFSLVVFSAFLYSWSSLDAGLHFNFQRMLAFGSFSPLSTLFRLAAVILFCSFLGRAGVPPGLFFGSLALWFLYQVWNQGLSRQLAGPESKGLYFPKREYLDFGLWVGIGQFGFLATTRLPALSAELLGFDKEEIGWMGLALFCFATLRVLPMALSSSLLPHFVTLAHQGHEEEFRRCASESWRYTNLFLFWLLLGLLSLAPGWFPLLLGGDYAASMPAILSLLRWTVPAIAFGVWLNFFQQLVYARGRQKAFITGALFVLAVFPLSLFLAPQSLGIRRLLIALAASMAAGTGAMGYCAGRMQDAARSCLVPLGLFLLLTLPAYWIPAQPAAELATFLALQTPLYFILNGMLGLLTSKDRLRVAEVCRRALAAASAKPADPL